ncbi:unnamed protein product [Sphagnum balticum]
MECSFPCLMGSSRVVALDAAAAKSRGVQESRLEIVSLRNLLETSVLPPAKKAEFRARLNELQDRIRAAQKAAVGMNLLASAMVAASPSSEEAVRSAMRLADEAVARNDIYCVVQVNVGLDTNALREAVMAIMNNQKDLAVMIFSVEEVKKLGAIVCAGVPQVAAKRGFRVLDWLHAALQPIDGATVFVKGGIAMGQSENATSIDEALEMAINYAKHCQ